MNNYLVNITGKPGMFSKLNLLQEHNNFLIKVLFNSKSFLFDSVHIAELIGLNIRGFKQLRELFPTWIGGHAKGGKHTDPNKSADINRLGEFYQRNRLMQYCMNRSERYLVRNEFNIGIDILWDGKVKDFVKRTTSQEWNVSNSSEDV